MSARPPGPRRPGRLTSGGRRRLSVLLELAVAVAVCLLGYRVGAEWMQVHEARWVVAALHLLGVDQVSGTLPGRILIFRPDGEILNAVVTTSCSALLSMLGLTALTLTVLRSRRLHALAGLLGAVVGVVVLNDLRLLGSTLAGLWWGRGALVLFHDWVGTVWSFATTLAGFLLMVCLTLPAAERAEQNKAGHHTARRPSSWARPGLGYRLPELDDAVQPRRRTLTGLFYRFVLPRPVARRLAARREAGRVDYRLGHLPADQRAAQVRLLAEAGLGAHTATLLAVATYEQDPAVLDVLADAVAARQWEPVVDDRVAALRLWARGWLFHRPPVIAEESPAVPDHRFPRLAAAVAAGPVPVQGLAAPPAPRPGFARLAEAVAAGPVPTRPHPVARPLPARSLTEDPR